MKFIKRIIGAVFIIATLVPVSIFSSACEDTSSYEEKASYIIAETDNSENNVDNKTQNPVENNLKPPEDGVEENIIYISYLSIPEEINLLNNGVGISFIVDRLPENTTEKICIEIENTSIVNFGSEISEEDQSRLVDFTTVGNVLYPLSVGQTIIKLSAKSSENEMIEKTCIVIVEAVAEGDDQEGEGDGESGEENNQNEQEADEEEGENNQNDQEADDNGDENVDPGDESGSGIPDEDKNPDNSNPDEPEVEESNYYFEFFIVSANSDIKFDFENKIITMTSLKLAEEKTVIVTCVVYKDGEKAESQYLELTFDESFATGEKSVLKMLFLEIKKSGSFTLEITDTISKTSTTFTIIVNE